MMMVVARMTHQCSRECTEEGAKEYIDFFSCPHLGLPGKPATKPLSKQMQNTKGKWKYEYQYTCEYKGKLEYKYKNANTNTNSNLNTNTRKIQTHI